MTAPIKIPFGKLAAQWASEGSTQHASLVQALQGLGDIFMLFLPSNHSLRPDPQPLSLDIRYWALNTPPLPKDVSFSGSPIVFEHSYLAATGKYSFKLTGAADERLTLGITFFLRTREDHSVKLKVTRHVTATEEGVEVEGENKTNNREARVGFRRAASSTEALRVESFHYQEIGVPGCSEKGVLLRPPPWQPPFNEVLRFLQSCAFYASCGVPDESQKTVFRPGVDLIDWDAKTTWTIPTNFSFLRQPGKPRIVQNPHALALLEAHYQNRTPRITPEQLYGALQDVEEFLAKGDVLQAHLKLLTLFCVVPCENAAAWLDSLPTVSLNNITFRTWLERGKTIIANLEHGEKLDAQHQDSRIQESASKRRVQELQELSKWLEALAKGRKTKFHLERNTKVGLVRYVDAIHTFLFGSSATLPTKAELEALRASIKECVPTKREKQKDALAMLDKIINELPSPSFGRERLRRIAKIAEENDAESLASACDALASRFP